MHILDLLEDIRLNREKEKQYSDERKALEAATTIYQQQKIAIDKIKDTQGFKEIIAYFTRVKEGAEITMTAHGIDAKAERDALSTFKIAKEFLLFLKNIASK